MLDSFDMTQLIEFSTHVTPTSYIDIDIIATTCASQIDFMDSVDADNISDYEVIFCTLKLFRLIAKHKIKLFRNLRLSKTDAFQTDLHPRPRHHTFSLPTDDERVAYFCPYLLHLFDFHVPKRRIGCSRYTALRLNANDKYLIYLKDKNTVAYDDYKL